jgi:hypothetical protein
MTALGQKAVMVDALEVERPRIIAANHTCVPLIGQIDFDANSGFW